MTAARQSQVIVLEKEFGKGRPYNANGQPEADWIHVPPGSFMQFTLQRATNRINTSGSKFFDAVAYGQLRGKWDWSFVLDYNYLEPLLLVFDKYNCKQFKRSRTRASASEAWSEWSDWEDIGTDPIENSTLVEYETCFEHYFTKRNGNRVPSFAVREVILHGIAGNDDEYPDEIRYVKGCVCESIRFSQSAGNSQMSVSMSGFYVNEEMHRVALDATDYEDYDDIDGLIEYFCLFLDKFIDPYYVANTESLGLSINLSTAPIANTCCPFSQQFYEGYTTFQFDTSCWANDPKRYKERMYRGGKTTNVKVKNDIVEEEWMNFNDNILAERTADYTNNGADPYTTQTNLRNKATLAKPDGYMFKPACKGLAPMDDAWMVSYNLCRTEVTAADKDPAISTHATEYADEGKHSIRKAIDKSDKMVKIHITKTVINSATWQKGDGSKLYDQLSSTECRLVDLTIRNHISSLATTKTNGTAEKFLQHTTVVAGETRAPQQ